MPHYELLFSAELDTGERVLREDETFQLPSKSWRVEKVESDAAGRPRVHLVQTSDGEGTCGNGSESAAPAGRPISLGAELVDVEAHANGQVTTFEVPSSFEGELVYTLNDISSRLSTLARVLNAYWGKGAA